MPSGSSLPALLEVIDADTYAHAPASLYRRVVVDGADQIGNVAAENRDLLRLIAARNVGAREQAHVAAFQDLDRAHAQELVGDGARRNVAAELAHQRRKAARRAVHRQLRGAAALVVVALL